MFASVVSFSEAACVVVVSVPAEISFVSLAVAACSIERWFLCSFVVVVFHSVAVFCWQPFLKF